MTFTLANHNLDERVFIVAEIGVNHEGDLDTAKMLVQQAAEAGVDAVKFQTYLPEEYVTAADAARFERVGRFALTFEDFRELAAVAEQAGVVFFSTPLGTQSADAIESLVPVYKISSGDLTYHSLLAHVAAKGKPVIISTGGAALEEIDAAVEVLRENGPDRPLSEWLLINQCVACYPAPLEEINLHAMATLRERYGVTVGYSDHTLGSAVSVAAVALGARYIEKHFTDSKQNRAFHDHAISTEPSEMRQLVEDVRAVEQALGGAHKAPTPCEEEKLGRLRRGAAYARDMQPGDILAEGDIIWLRPETEYPIGSEETLIGRPLVRPVREGYQVTQADLGQA